MAEIKSTLDIIMERTKNLIITEEERNAFRQKEWESKIKGWVQKHKDGLIEGETLKSTFHAEVKKYPELRKILQGELLDRIELNGDNRKTYQLFETLLGIKANDFEQIILSFKSEFDAQRIKRVKSLEEELRARKIYGTSLVPNPNHDGTWQTYTRKFESDFKAHLKSFHR